MSTDALRATTVALQRLIHTAVGRDKDTDALTGSPDDWVYIGPPIRGPLGVGDCPVSLFLFHVVPNGELRNAPLARGEPIHRLLEDRRVSWRISARSALQHLDPQLERLT